MLVDEFEVVLSSQTYSVVIFGDILVEMLLRRILTVSGSDELEKDPFFLEIGVVSDESLWDSCIDFVSHGLVAIQWSNQSSPEQL